MRTLLLVKCCSSKIRDWYTNHGLKVQSTLGFTTMGLAANLDIATATLLTDRQYIIATMGIMTSNFCTYIVK